MKYSSLPKICFQEIHTFSVFYFFWYEIFLFYNLILYHSNLSGWIISSKNDNLLHLRWILEKSWKATSFFFIQNPRNFRKGRTFKKHKNFIHTYHLIYRILDESIKIYPLWQKHPVINMLKYQINIIRQKRDALWSAIVIYIA